MGVQTKREAQQRNHDRAAADAEHAGQHTDEDARDRKADECSQ